MVDAKSWRPILLPAMPILKPQTFEESYRLRASLPDSHELSGRREKHITELVSRSILKVMAVSRHDVLVDVGCGDGTLLKLCSCTAIGILPSQEEVERVHLEHPDLDIRLGLAEHLPFANPVATKVVCNSVLLGMGTDAKVSRILAEISRISKPGADIYIGEVPYIDEYAQRRGQDSRSVITWLRHYRRTHSSIRPFVGAVKTVVTAAFTSKQFFLEPISLYVASPERFALLAQSAELKLVRRFPSPSAATRFDYVLRKA